MIARRRVSRRGFLLGLAGLTLGLPACSQDGHFTVLGYTTKPNYNTEIHTVHVPVFKNHTMRQGLEFLLTKEVVRQIQLKTPYRVVSSWKDADTELTGTIVLANKSILNRNQLNEIREAETSLVVELVWPKAFRPTMSKRAKINESFFIRADSERLILPGKACLLTTPQRL